MKTRKHLKDDCTREMMTFGNKCMNCGMGYENEPQPTHDSGHPKAEHTPTPWGTDFNAGHAEDIYSGTQRVAHCAETQDAAFIVRAVNSHEELVEKLRILAYSGQYKSTVISEAFLDSCVKAIARAEGRA